MFTHTTVKVFLSMHVCFHEASPWSLAFGELRHDFVREEFGLVLPASIAGIALVVWGLRRIGRALMSMRFDDRGGVS